MNGLPFRHRLICFLSVAAPALSAFLLGRLLTNCSEIFRSYYNAGDSTAPLSAVTRLILAAGTSGTSARAGEIAAIAVASIGFLLVHRLAPDRAVRGVLILVLMAWSIEMAVLMISLVAFAAPLTSQ